MTLRKSSATDPLDSWKSLCALVVSSISASASAVLPCGADRQVDVQLPMHVGRFRILAYRKVIEALLSEFQLGASLFRSLALLRMFLFERLVNSMSSSTTPLTRCSPWPCP